MANPLLWIEALAGLRTLYDLAHGASDDYFSGYERHRQDATTIREAQRVSSTFSSFSDREIENLIQNIEVCRGWFLSQDSRRDRARYLCGIFDEIKDAHDGWLPNIDDWYRMYSVLRCGVETLH